MYRSISPGERGPLGLRSAPEWCFLTWRARAWKAEKLSSADTLENNQNPEASETGHEGHDHSHDHDHEHAHDHTHNHGPVLNPECTRELVLDIPAEDVEKSFRK